MTTPRLLALLGAACLSTVSLLADDLQQQVAFAAMQKNDPKLVESVQYLIQTGFMQEIVGLAQRHVEACDANAKDIAAKVRCFAFDYVDNQYQVSFGSSGSRSPYNIRITSIRWNPGDRTAMVIAAFDVGGDRDARLTNCTLTMEVDVKLWVMANVKRDC